ARFVPLRLLREKGRISRVPSLPRRDPSHDREGTSTRRRVLRPLRPVAHGEFKAYERTRPAHCRLRRTEGTSSCQGGSWSDAVVRAAAIGGPVVGKPRCSKISVTTFFSVMKATTTRRPPHGQRRTSSRKTRKSSSAHGMRESGRRDGNGWDA